MGLLEGGQVRGAVSGRTRPGRHAGRVTSEWNAAVARWPRWGVAEGSGVSGLRHLLLRVGGPEARAAGEPLLLQEWELLGQEVVQRGVLLQGFAPARVVVGQQGGSAPEQCCRVGEASRVELPLEC